MNSDQIQALINLGASLATPFLGRTTQWYRPTDPTCPALDPANQMGTLSVRFDTDPSFKSTKPPLLGKPQWYGLYDRTNTQVGDYLVSDQGTFYIESEVNLMPTAVIQCNRTITISRKTLGNPSSQPGKAYGGDRKNHDDVILYPDFPASLLTKSRGERGDTNLPKDVKLGTYEILLPNVGKVTIHSADRIRDDLGYLYSVSSVELTPLGYRLLVVATQT
jgi:hypothetical protein